MSNSALPYWLALAVLVVASYGGFKLYQVQNSSGTAVVGRSELPPLEDFELTDQDGRPFRSADMLGKVWVASFFYVKCPDTCGRLNANIKYLTQQPELADVRWVSITVDPLTDTQEALRENAAKLNADTERWSFCRHDDFAYIKRLSDDVLRVGGVNYQGHNNYVVVIDRDGEVAGMFNGYDGTSLERGVKLLKELLAKPQQDSQAAASPAEAA